MIGFIQQKINNIVKVFPNTILLGASTSLASMLANKEEEKLYISHMLFGDGGNKKEVSRERTSLFGITRLKKPVIVQIDVDFPTVVMFTVTIEKVDANGYILNEMALQLNNGVLYSMSTFADLEKTEDMEIDWTWGLDFG